MPELPQVHEGGSLAGVGMRLIKRGWAPLGPWVWKESGSVVSRWKSPSIAGKDLSAEGEESRTELASPSPPGDRVEICLKSAFSLSSPISCPFLAHLVPVCPTLSCGALREWLGTAGEDSLGAPLATRGVHPHVPRVAAATSASEHVQGLSGMCWLFMLVSQIRSLFSPQAVRAEVSLCGLNSLPHKSIPPSRPDENKGEAKQTANKQKPSTQPWVGSAW